MFQSPNQVEGVIPQELSQEEERTLYHFGVERMLLAAIFKQPNLIYRVESEIDPSQFFFPDHSYIYSIMLDVASVSALKGWALGYSHDTMLAFARTKGQEYVDKFWNSTDGMNKVRELEALVPRVDLSQVNHLIDQLKRTHLRVQMYKHSRHLQLQLLDQSNKNLRDIAFAAESGFSDLLHGQVGEADVLGRLGDEGRMYERRAELAMHHPYQDLYLTVIPEMPHLMYLQGGGLRRGGLCMISARPKVGKTSFLLNMCMPLAVFYNTPCLFIDTEMSREEIYHRCLSILSGIPEQDIMRGKCMYDPATAQQFMEAKAKLDASPFYYVSLRRRGIEHAIAQMSKFHSHAVQKKDYVVPSTGEVVRLSRPSLAVYDWLKMTDFKSVGPGSNVKEHQILGDYASQLKDASAEFDIATIAACQQNREIVGASISTWEIEQERFIAASDRISQFCTMLCSLRRLFPEEREGLQKQFGDAPRGADRADDAAIPYNSVLGIAYNRFGPEYREGIPLYHDLGRYRFTEWGKRSGDYVKATDPYGSMWQAVTDWRTEANNQRRKIKKKQKSSTPVQVKDKSDLSVAMGTLPSGADLVSAENGPVAPG